MILNGHGIRRLLGAQGRHHFYQRGELLYDHLRRVAGLATIADTLSEPRAIGRLNQVCERWIYTCLCFALDFDEQKRSGFRYQYSSYQIEYSRNLIFQVAGIWTRCFRP